MASWYFSLVAQHHGPIDQQIDVAGIQFECGDEDFMGAFGLPAHEPRLGGVPQDLGLEGGLRHDFLSQGLEAPRRLVMLSETHERLGGAVPGGVTAAQVAPHQGLFEGFIGVFSGEGHTGAVFGGVIELGGRRRGGGEGGEYDKGRRTSVHGLVPDALHPIDLGIGPYRLRSKRSKT